MIEIKTHKPTVHLHHSLKRVPSLKRHTGIDAVGDMPWGTHFCQFYKTKDDLLDILVPYFCLGLENNEYCMWITSEPLNVEEAYAAIKKALPDFDKYLAKGQIEILSYTEWYTIGGKFEEERVLNGWVSRLEKALSKGFEGLRLTGNTFWLESKDWDVFTDYEESINRVISKYKMLALCTYSLDKCAANEIIDVVANHEFALIKRDGKWILIENMEHKKTINALLQSEERFRSVLDNSWDIIYRLNLQSHFFEYLSPSVTKVLGFSAEEMKSQDMESMIHPDYIAEFKTAQALMKKTGKAEVEYIQLTKDGDPRWVSNRMSLIRDELGQPLYQDGNIRDITERKKVEEALRESENRLRVALEAANFGTWDLDIASGVAVRSLRHDQIFGYTDHQPEWSVKIAERHMLPEDRPVFQKAFEHATKTGVLAFEARVQWPDGSIHWISGVGSTHVHGNPNRMFGVVADITERKKSELILKDSQEKLELALTNGNIGIWEWDPKTDAITWDQKVIEMHSAMNASSIKNLKAFEELINEDDLPHVKQALKKALEEDIPFDTIYRIKASPNAVYINSKAHVYKDENGIPFRMLGVCIDITQMKKSTDEALFKLNEELMRSNKELQSFAYVASHDLQEPLRMVASFTQLLSQRYKDQLDKNAQEYIQYAVDGANRMYELLNGLLAYSRIHTKGDRFKIVDMEKTLILVKQNLSMTINEKNAVITWDKLPIVFADELQIFQLLQNLVGNAIKFCSTNPRIHISSVVENNKCIFLVKDNGIGIDSQYFEKIFQIYQRLHSRLEYSGTGIGLAICKRIVERHNGKIWLESEPGKGSTFFFSIPKPD